MKYLIFLGKKTYTVRYKYVPWKNVWVCIISIVWVHFDHKNEKFWFWKSLKYIKNKIWRQIWLYPMKNLWFYFIPLFVFTLSILKVTILKFFFIKKWCQIWICPIKQCLIWLKLRCLSRILAISWEIRTLDQNLSCFFVLFVFFCTAIEKVSN